MSTQVYGDLSTNAKNVKITLTSQTSNGTSSVNTGGQIIQEFDVLWTDRATYTPAQFTACPDYPNFLLTNATQEMRLLGMCHITLTYQASYSATPATQYTEQNGSMDIPIEEHPDFDDWADEELFDDNGQFIGFIDTSDKYGVTSYIGPTSIVTKKEYFTSEPTDERGTIGQTQNPGRDYEGDTNWLIIGSSRALEGLFWTRTTTFRWSAVDWNADVYPAA
jgi:hypothetical protein